MYVSNTMLWNASREYTKTHNNSYNHNYNYRKVGEPLQLTLWDCDYPHDNVIILQSKNIQWSGLLCSKRQALI